MDTDPKLRRLATGQAVFLHPCCICGNAYAPFGFGVSLRNSKPGRWYCADHKAEANDGQTKQAGAASGIGAGIANEAESLPRLDQSRDDHAGTGKSQDSLFD